MRKVSRTAKVIRKFLGHTLGGTILLLAACVNPAQRRADELGQMVSHFRTKDDYIRAFGAPRCTSLSSGEMCDFVRDLGVQGGSFSMPITNLYTGEVIGYSQQSNARQAYEMVRVEFDSSGYARGGAQVSVQY